MKFWFNKKRRKITKYKNQSENVEVERNSQYELEKAAYVRKQPVYFETVLTCNGSEQMQWEIQQVHKGDKIDVELDDNDRCLVSTKDAYDVGYLRKSLYDKFEDLFNDGYEIVDGEIIDIIENAGKYGVKVHIVLEDRAYL